MDGDPHLPLFCSICPKQPSFSDVSHLLTHIGSKAHLACYFKTKIRSQTDPQWRRIIDDYDSWYNEWGMEELMAERIHLKDRKRIRNGATNLASTPAHRRSIGLPTNRRFTAGLPVNRGPSTPINRSRLGGSHHVPLGSLDPELEQPEVKAEQNRTTGLPTGSESQSPRLPSSGARSLLQQHFTRRHASMGRSPLAQSRGIRRMGYDSSGSLVSMGSETELSVIDDAVAVDSDDEGAPILKGVFWPGMDLFDSATPIQRRRRNQKKDESVLLRLRSNSLLVERTETTLNPDWTLHQERDIDALPSSSPPPDSPRLSHVQRDSQRNRDEHRSQRRQVAKTSSITSRSQNRYNLRQSDHDIRYQEDSEITPETTLPTQKKKRSFNVRRDEPRASRGSMAATYEDDEDDLYVPDPRRRRRLNGSSIGGATGAYGFPPSMRPVSRGEPSGHNGGASTDHSRKNSHVMTPEEEAMYLAAIEHIQNVNMAHPQLALNPAMLMRNPYANMSGMARNQTNLSLEGFEDDGFDMNNATAMGHHSLGLGQYPGPGQGYFPFGMHPGFGMGYGNSGYHHFNPFNQTGAQGMHGNQTLWPGYGIQGDDTVTHQSTGQAILGLNQRVGNAADEQSDDLPPLPPMGSVRPASRPSTAMGSGFGYGRGFGHRGTTVGAMTAGTRRAFTGPHESTHMGGLSAEAAHTAEIGPEQRNGVIGSPDLPQHHAAAGLDMEDTDDERTISEKINSTPIGF